MLVIAGSLSFPPSEREYAIDRLREITAVSRQDPGCVEYWWAESLDEPNTFQFFECWESRELFDAHISAPHEKTFGERVLPRITGATARMFAADPD